MQKQNMFLIKKVVTRFDKKNSDMAEKEHWWKEESITADPKEEDWHGRKRALMKRRIYYCRP